MRERRQIYRSSAYSLTNARSRTDTFVVAAMNSGTKNGEETTTQHWWPDLQGMGHFILRPRSRKREYDRGPEGGAIERPPQPSAGKLAKSRSTRSGATDQYEYSGQEVEQVRNTEPYSSSRLEGAQTKCKRGRPNEIRGAALLRRSEGSL